VIGGHVKVGPDVKKEGYKIHKFVHIMHKSTKKNKLMEEKGKDE
jgi:hypothetical protein